MTKRSCSLLLAALLLLAAIGTAVAATLPYGETVTFPADVLATDTPAGWLVGEIQRGLFALLAEGDLDDAYPDEGVTVGRDMDKGYIVAQKDDAAICAWESMLGDLYIVTYSSSGATACKQSGVTLAEYLQTMTSQGCPVYEITETDAINAFMVMLEKMVADTAVDLYETAARIELEADDPLLELPKRFQALAQTDRAALATEAIQASSETLWLCQGIGTNKLLVDELCMIGSPEACTVLFKVFYEEDYDREDVVSATVSDALYVRKYAGTTTAEVKKLFAGQGEVIDFTGDEIHAGVVSYQDARGK